MILEQAIKQAKSIEKDLGKNCIVYQVYENQKLIYTGIGGKGKRKGSGRLSEHNSESLYSSFRFQYYVSKWDLGYSRNETNQMWNNLEWEITQFETIKEADLLETQLIQNHKPKFNRDKKL